MRTSAAVAAVLLAIASVAFAQEPDDAAGPSGRLSGVVLGGGAPLANAWVVVTEVGSRPERRDAATNARGEFEVEGLRGSAYYVDAAAPSYTPERFGEGERPLYRPGERVTLRLAKGGVVTGRVTDREGRPVTGCPVRAHRTRDTDGRPAEASRAFETRETDDRGIYRIYGLPPGAYVVSAGGEAMGAWPGRSVFSRDGHVYHPSSSRAGATEIRVGPGEEVTGVDIGYRAIETYVVSGTLAGAVPEGGWKSVSATSAGDGIAVASSNVERRGGQWSFALPAVPDGEYELVGTAYDNQRRAGVSEPRRVVVRGADVTGVALVLSPLGAVEGRVAVERVPREGACEGRAKSGPAGIVVAARAARASRQPGRVPGAAVAGPDGSFLVAELDPGLHWMEVRSLDEMLYVRSIASKERDAARDGVAVSGGKTAGGLAVTLAEGAAAVSGRVAAEGGGAPAGDVAVHLVPAEPERAGDALRYHVAWAEADGSFTVRNVAPGRYRAVAVRPPGDEPAATWRHRVAGDAALRERIRRDAEAAGVEVELAPCARAEKLALTCRESPGRQR